MTLGDEARARRDRRVAERRRVILAAARRLLDTAGPEAFTLAAVARAADLSKAAVFYYFADRQELVGALTVELLREEADVLVAAIDAAPDGVTSLEAMLRTKVALYAEDPDRFRAVYIWPLALGIPARLFPEAIYPIGDRVNGRLEARLREAPLHPDVRPRVLANLAWLLANGILSFVQSIHQLGGDTRFPLRALTDEACATLRRSVSP